MSVPIQLAIGVGDRVPISLLGGSSATWGKSYGVAPFYSEIETSRHRAVEIYEQSRLAFPQEEGTITRAAALATGPVSIYVRPSQGPDRTFQNLFAVGLLPGSNPRLARVLIVDSRYWLGWRTIERAYNVRRLSGDFRLVGGAMVDVAGRERVADYTFEGPSLRLGQFEWKAREALEDAMTELVGVGRFVIPEGLLDYDGWTDGVTLRGRGDGQLSRLLTYLPGIHPYQRDDGVLSFVNAHDGSEAAVAEELLGTQVKGSVFTAPKSAIRWRACNVRFPVRCDLRANFVDLGGEDDTTSGSSVTPGEEPLIFENVGECPLYKLKLADGREATQGQYVPMPQLVAAFNLLKASKPLVNQSFGNLTQADIRECILGKPEALRIDHCLLTNGQAYDGELSLLLATILDHWRTTFRISAAWASKVRSFSDRLGAVIDPENGSRGQAMAFTQWIEQLNQQGVSYKQPDQGITFDDYAEDLSEAKASPFRVSILDETNGIFSLSPRVHQRQTASNYVIGTPESSLPTDVLNDVLDFWHEVTLKKEFRLAVILSAAINSPNNSGRLFAKTVTLADACERLGVEAPSESFGPDRNLVVEIEEARFGHATGKEEQILGRIYGREGVEWPEDMLANRDAIEQLALSAAAQDLANRLDRVQGTLVVSHLPEHELTGNLRDVIYTIAVLPNGHATVTSTFNFPGAVNPPSLESLLPEQTRRVIFRQVAR